MNAWVSVLALAVLGLLVLYLAYLVLEAVRRSRLTRRTAALEREQLHMQIAAVLDQRSRERKRSELSWNGYRKFRVERKVDEGADICSFYLKPHDGKALPEFAPGQFLTFRLNIPSQPKPVIRCYSLSDCARPEYYRVSIKRVPPPRDKPEAPPGLSSNFFHRAVSEGDFLDVQAPAGGFTLDLSVRQPVVLIGGGVGITPVLSMLNAIVHKGEPRETWFFLGVRNRKEHIMKEHLEQVAREHPYVKLQVCYSNPDDGDRAGKDFHHAGRVSADLFKKLLPSNNYDFYFCGPPPMMETLAADLDAWGVPAGRIHFEAFGPASVKKMHAQKGSRRLPVVDGPAAPAARKVSFQRAAKTCDWTPEAGSILEFAEAQGVSLDSGCRAGNCGTCVTAIVAGEVEYDQAPAFACDAGSCLVCIAKPKGDLTLDA